MGTSAAGCESGNLGKSPLFVQLFRPLQACAKACARYRGE
jgi:hypothetical protein